VLEAPRASRVALVGDFNAWDAAATPLARMSSSGIWTVTIPLTPGRHTYAFMVDDTAWTLDPRAPTAQDPDFGTPSSVVLVGTP
jgi:1,4-alpha-glucan branching enzyme